LDPLDLDQRVFYVLPTVGLDARTRSQHSITLKTLQGLTAVVGFGGLRQAVQRLLSQQDLPASQERAASIRPVVAAGYRARRTTQRAGTFLFAWTADLHAYAGACALGRLVRRVCAMTSAVVARLIYQMLFSQDVPGQ
jgi:hypothetical protein